MLEKHHQDHMENREQEDREHEQMVADMTFIRVKRRAEKEDKQVADIHGEGQRRQPAEEVKGGEEVLLSLPSRRRRRWQLMQAAMALKNLDMQKLSTIALYSSILWPWVIFNKVSTALYTFFAFLRQLAGNWVSE